MTIRAKEEQDEEEKYFKFSSINYDKKRCVSWAYSDDHLLTNYLLPDISFLFMRESPRLGTEFSLFYYETTSHGLQLHTKVRFKTHKIGASKTKKQLYR